jgi:hypothetical protein
LDLVLIPAASVTFKGRLELPSGAAIANFILDFSPVAGGSTATTNGDANGDFQLALVPGKYSVWGRCWNCRNGRTGLPSNFYVQEILETELNLTTDTQKTLKWDSLPTRFRTNLRRKAVLDCCSNFWWSASTSS